MELVSIVVPTFNRLQSLSVTLRSLCHQIYPAASMEVIVVDNGSTDGTAAYLEALDTPYRLIVVRAEKRKPFESSRLRNVGVQAASGDIIVFLDSDMLVTRRFVKQHVAYHRLVPNAGVLGKMMYLDTNDRLNDALVSRDFHPSELGKLHLVGNSVHKFLEMSGNLRQYFRPWDFCIGANVSVCRSALDAAGSFDESLDGDLPAAADAAYGLQMYARGVNLLYGRGAIGFHQKNHPIFRGEAPEYFARRTESVLSREEEVHAKWLPAAEWALVQAQIHQKRTLTERVSTVGGQLTFVAERGVLGRVPAFRHESPRLLLSLLITDRGDEFALPATLDTLAKQDADPDTFEVIVLDPKAPVAPEDDRYEVWTDAAVQRTDAPYMLRYFPAERCRHEERLRAMTNPQNGEDELCGVDEGMIGAERRWFSRYVRSLLLEKPLAPVALNIEAGTALPSRFISETANFLYQ